MTKQDLGDGGSLEFPDSKVHMSLQIEISRERNLEKTLKNIDKKDLKDSMEMSKTSLVI